MLNIMRQWLKFFLQRSWLAFDLSAKVAQVESLQHLFQKPLGLSREFKFHMKTPYNRLAKIYTNCSGHMTKMATMPIYGKKPLNIFFSGTKRPIALGLVI